MTSAECVGVRTLANPADAADVKAAHTLQDAITADQARTGSFEVPVWDTTSQNKVRAALETLNVSGAPGPKFGKKTEVDPVGYLVGAAVGWGGNPEYAAIYKSVYPRANNGKTVHTLTVKNVPVDGFWSISLYNAKGFFEKNAAQRLLTEQPDGKAKCRRLVHRAVWGLSDEHEQLSADPTRLELYRPALSRAETASGWHVDVPRGTTGQVGGATVGDCSRR